VSRLCGYPPELLLDIMQRGTPTLPRPEKVQELLRSLGDGTTPLTHDGLDQYEPSGRHVDHLRAILRHNEVLPARDKYLANFERWIDDKLRPVTDPEIAMRIRQFATWHHLKRINELALAGKPTRGPVHASKQDITEALKFLAGVGQASFWQGISTRTVQVRGRIRTLPDLATSARSQPGSE
jgi:hypothetical protein